MKDLNSHVAKGRCSVSEKRPALLLGPQEEAELGADNRTQNRASETDKWWQLFRLAYPNMSNDEVDTLKAICPDYPCDVYTAKRMTSTSMLTLYLQTISIPKILIR